MKTLQSTKVTASAQRIQCSPEIRFSGESPAQVLNIFPSSDIPEVGEETCDRGVHCECVLTDYASDW